MGTENPKVIVTRTDVALRFFGDAVREERRANLEIVNAGQDAIAAEKPNRRRVAIVDDLTHVDAWHFTDDSYDLMGRRYFFHWRNITENRTKPRQR